MFSIAVTWLALSPSNLPAAVSSLTPSALAAFCAPSFIFTKNGFVSVLVIRPTLAAAAVSVEVSWPLPPHPVTRSAAASRPAESLEIMVASYQGGSNVIVDICQR